MGVISRLRGNTIRVFLDDPLLEPLLVAALDERSEEASDVACVVESQSENQDQDQSLFLGAQEHPHTLAVLQVVVEGDVIHLRICLLVSDSAHAIVFGQPGKSTLGGFVLASGNEILFFVDS
eukprot:CAMPEP_0170497156 /NCGR_PEP_ID=MMETSP0208-20121228/23897_1 /TAXON_ID=197538 /ORGANISM="Strombidium inclinatum, Strain S3" /LENGTH=121 /DNA_ID=CAMNT_0010773885 /DNA_START=194 /DNA_END=556 /DNA_ORIENTATION=+